MTAIYVRQSVERAGSISIAMQQETCQRQLPADTPCKIYEDRGFSGTNTQRPAFQQLLRDVESGSIQEVCVYKLDRISRSLSDFAAMMQLFRSRGVTLRSCRESFDTQTEIGGMLLNLLMMFAELEQKTIAGRIRDNYCARAQQHLPLGGVVPFGYSPGSGQIYQADPAESRVVTGFYRQYAIDGANVDQIVQMANQQGLRTRRGAHWCGSAVLRILRNPVYVQGNMQVLRYFRQKDAQLLHPPAAYCTGNGLIAYESRDESGKKQLRLAAGLHPGIVDAALWLTVQQRLMHRGGSRNSGTGQRSYLQGLVICGLCGESCYVRSNGKGAAYTYFVCRGHRLGICPGLRALRVSPVESSVEAALAVRAAEILPYGRVDAPSAPDGDVLLLEELEDKMRRMLREFGDGGCSGDILRQELQRLTNQRDALARRIRRKAVPPQSPAHRWQAWWHNADLTQRRQAASILIRQIRLFDDHGELEWM